MLRPARPLSPPSQAPASVTRCLVAASIAAACAVVAHLSFGIAINRAVGPGMGTLLDEVLAIGASAVLACALGGLRLSMLGLSRPRLAHLGIAVVVTVINLPAVSLLEEAGRKLASPEHVATFDAYYRFLSELALTGGPAFALAVVLAAPLCEELLFRGVLLPTLSRPLGVWPGLLATGLLFAGFHLDPVGFWGLCELGMLFGALRIWSGSLWVAVAAHATNNAITVVALRAGLIDPGSPPSSWMLMLGALALLLLGSLAVRFVPRAAQAPEREAELRAGGPWGWACGAAWLLAAGYGVVAGILPLLRER